MTLESLKNRITVYWWSYGTYKVIVEYRGRFYHGLSHNSSAYDRIKHCWHCEPYSREDGFTLKQAYEHFYFDCLRQNGINI